MGMGKVFAAVPPWSQIGTPLAGRVMAPASHTLEQRPPGRYSTAVAAHEPQHEATPRSK